MLSLKQPLARALLCLAIGLACACSDADKEVSTGAVGIAGSDAGEDSEGDASDTRPDDDAAVCAPSKQRADPLKAPVDVVWILDGSPSMLPHALEVGDNMLPFIAAVRRAAVDIHVVMLTGSAFGPFLKVAIADESYLWVESDVKNHDAFTQTVAAYDQYAQFLRPDAPMHFIVVTDDSSGTPAGEFLTQIMSKHGRPFFVHAVAADGDFVSSGSCAGSGAGTEYFAAADATMGDRISLCSDWADNFERLEDSVIASVPLHCAYALPALPVGQRLEPGELQVLLTARGRAAEELAQALSAAQCGDDRAWYFDDDAAPSSVLLCPEACQAVQRGGALELGFGCAPRVVSQSFQP